MANETILSIKVWDVVIYGTTAEKYCALDIPSKMEWIAKHTSLKDETQIREYLNLAPKPYNGGCGCGGVQTKKEDVNISSGIPQEIENANTANFAESGSQGGDEAPTAGDGLKGARTKKGRTS